MARSACRSRPRALTISRSQASVPVICTAMRRRSAASALETAIVNAASAAMRKLILDRTMSILDGTPPRLSGHSSRRAASVRARRRRMATQTALGAKTCQLSISQVIGPGSRAGRPLQLYSAWQRRVRQRAAKGKHQTICPRPFNISLVQGFCGDGPVQRRCVTFALSKRTSQHRTNVPWRRAQVAYWANVTVRARARSSVLTLTSATEPRSTSRWARFKAGRISLGRSTYSP